MCGVVGFLVATTPASSEDNARQLARMSDALLHRGPDDAGAWWDAPAQIYLGHRRLAIVDVSAAGHQPMASASGRYVMAFNGEIYNHATLRAEIEAAGRAPAWRGHSDTETVLAAFDLWGVEATLHRCIGMFAMAIWDRAERTLLLARDRLGEKPLYYGWQQRGAHRAFVFGSELKALRPHPAFEGEIDREALGALMRHNCIGGEQSIYRGIGKLPPGSLLTLSLERPEPRLHHWWRLVDVATEGARNRFTGTPEEATRQLEAILRDAVRQQMVADVPLGAFLSGGIDSSTVVALMQEQASQPVRTFSIGFEEEGYNEAEHAKQVALHLRTDHTELYVTPKQAMDVIPRLPSLYCEPFADSSQLPTFLVSQLARGHVTVALSGDAGDELFAGYERYRATASVWHRIERVPRPLRRVAAAALTAVPVSALERAGNWLGRPRLGDRLHKGADLLACRNIDELYRGMVSHWADPASVVVGLAPNASAPSRVAPPHADGLGDIERMMARDMTNYLPDDILVKVDRAAMGVSLETRVPMLDHRVVEFAWRLPLECKLRDGVTKWVLRQVLYRHVPRQLVERPKMGFGVPIDRWLRGPLRDWAETLLDESRLRREGYFHPAPVRKRWAEHVSGQRNWQYHLWDVLVAQSWLEAQRKPAVAT